MEDEERHSVLEIMKELLVLRGTGSEIRSGEIYGFLAVFSTWSSVADQFNELKSEECKVKSFVLIKKLEKGSV